MLLVVVVAVGVIVIVLAVRDHNRAVNAEDRKWQPGQFATRELLEAAIDQETGLRGFVITGNEEFLARYASGRQHSAASIDELRTLMNGEADIEALVDTAETFLTAWQRQVAEAEIELARTDLGAAQEFVGTGLGTQLFDRFRDAQHALLAAIDRRFNDSAEQNDRAVVTLVVIAVVTLALLAFTAAILLHRSRRWIIGVRAIEHRLRSTIRTIQSSLLPASLPDIDAITGAVAFRPASADTDVGGDFYDLNITPAGLITISIGDVCGHDIHAAVVTTLVRHTINAASQHLIDPADVLRWANQAVNSQDNDDRFVSAAHGHLHPATTDRPAILALALAGHPYPILIPADGAPPREIGVAGTLLGITDAPEITSAHIELAAGDQVLLYTDGLVENSDPRLTIEGLLALVRNARSDNAADTAARLVEQYDALDLRTTRDDVAVLITQVRPIHAPAPPSPNDEQLQASTQ